MKKLVALAVAGAFVAPVYAADISISGDQEFSYQDNNGATETNLDGDFNIKASTQTANGWSVSADINVTAAAGDDGSASLTIAGPFGKLDLGDTSSAVDAIDDKTDFGYELTSGSPNLDAAVLWTLPTFVEGLTVNASFSADSNDASDGGSSAVFSGDPLAGTGVSVAYSVAGFGVGYGVLDEDSGADAKLVNVTYKIGGANLAYELLTYTAVGGSETEYRTLGGTYSMGDVTFGVENYEVSVDGAAPNEDVTTLGVHYSFGGGVTGFIEQSDDSEDDTANVTAIGVAFTF